MENLIAAMGDMESDKRKAGDEAEAERIRGQREFWETEVRRTGMSEQEWLAAGNAPLPPIPPRVRGPFGNVSVVEQQGENPLITNLPGRMPRQLPAELPSAPDMAASGVVDAEGIPRMAQPTRTILPPRQPTGGLAQALIAAARRRAAEAQEKERQKAKALQVRGKQAEVREQRLQKTAEFAQLHRAREAGRRDGEAAYTLEFESSNDRDAAQKQAVAAFRQAFGALLPGVVIADKEVPDFRRTYRKPTISAMERLKARVAKPVPSAKVKRPPVKGPAEIIKSYPRELEKAWGGGL